MDVYEELIRERSAGRSVRPGDDRQRRRLGAVLRHGEMLMLRADGTIVGTVGGGAAEAAVIARRNWRWPPASPGSSSSTCTKIRAWTSAWCAAAA